MDGGAQAELQLFCEKPSPRGRQFSSSRVSLSQSARAGDEDGGAAVRDAFTKHQSSFRGVLFIRILETGTESNHLKRTVLRWTRTLLHIPSQSLYMTSQWAN